jgi:hypothetical protein
MSKGYTAQIIALSENDINLLQDFHRGKTKKITFIKHLVSVKGLFGKNGVQLCSTQIAHALKISAQSVINYLKELISLGHIECIDSGYVVKLKSRTYRNSSSNLFQIFNKYCNKLKDKKKIKILEIRLKIRKKQIEAIRQINRKSKLTYRDCYNLAKYYKGFHTDLISDLKKYVLDSHLLNIASDVSPKPKQDSRIYKTFYYALRSVYKFCGMKKEFTIWDFECIISPYVIREKDKSHSPTRKVIGYKEFRGVRNSKLSDMLAIA